MTRWGGLVGQRLSSPLGRQVIVDHQPGAGGNLGAVLAAPAKPDGYTPCCWALLPTWR